MIYFLQPVTGGPVKIGTSTDVESRMNQLEAHYGQPLALLAVVEGGRAEERAWHERFAHLRLGRTEQFRPAPELMEAIGRPLLVGANPTAVAAMATAGAVTNIRSTQAWKDAVDKLADFDRAPSVADLVDRAIVAYARSVNFAEPIPKR